MEFSPAVDAYLIVAGPVGGDEAFEIFGWSGQAHDDSKPVEGSAAELAEPEQLTPEAMVLAADGGKVFVLSDDGDICGSSLSFRAVSVDLR